MSEPMRYLKHCKHTNGWVSYFESTCPACEEISEIKRCIDELYRILGVANEEGSEARKDDDATDSKATETGTEAKG